MTKVFVNRETSLFKVQIRHIDFSYPYYTLFFAFISNGLATLVTMRFVPLKTEAVSQVSPYLQAILHPINVKN